MSVIFIFIWIIFHYVLFVYFRDFNFLTSGCLLRISGFGWLSLFISFFFIVIPWITSYKCGKTLHSLPPVCSVTRSLVLCICFVDCCLSFFFPFSFGHCVVCSSSIYWFWLPIWNFQTRCFVWVYFFTGIVPDKGCSRNPSCTLNWMSPFYAVYSLYAYPSALCRFVLFSIVHVHSVFCTSLC